MTRPSLSVELRAPHQRAAKWNYEQEWRRAELNNYGLTNICPQRRGFRFVCAVAAVCPRRPLSHWEEPLHTLWITVRSTDDKPGSIDLAVGHFEKRKFTIC